MGQVQFFMTDRAVLFFTSSIMAKDARKQHALQTLRHQGRAPLL